MFVEIVLEIDDEVTLKLVNWTSKFLALFSPVALAKSISWLYLIRLALGVLLWEELEASLLALI